MTTDGDPGPPSDRQGDEPRERDRSSDLGLRASYPGRSTIRIVLLVAEDPEIREALTHYLIRQDLIPMPVPNAAQALVVCETVAPDVVLLDLELPHPESLALIRHIKAQLPETQLVVIAAAGERGARCRATSADDVLPRPINLERLGQILVRRLQLRPEHFLRGSPPRAPARRRPRQDETTY